MDLVYLEQLIPGLRAMDVEFEQGLTDAEVACVENKYQFRFPPDLRMLLQFALPVSNGFINWREDPEEEIRDSLDWPLEGMCFDIEANTFWLEAWGEKPRYLMEAFRVAKKAVRKAPKLIPVNGHRYIPDEPHLAGNAILSIWQTDIIFYGYDLADYFFFEFWRPDMKDYRIEHDLPELKRPDWTAKEPRPIRFWDEVMAWRGGGYAGNDYLPEELLPIEGD